MIDQIHEHGGGTQDMFAVDMVRVQAHMVPMTTKQDHARSWQMPDNIPLFTMLTVARAADVSPNTLRTWFQRGHVGLSAGDTPNAINGLANKFTLRSVMMIGVTAELVRLGVAPKLAFEAAEHWMTSGAIAGERGETVGREGGGLFPAPMLTYLVMGADGAPVPQGAPCEVIGVDPQTPAAHSRLFAALFARGRPAARIVLLNAIDRRVRQICEESILGENAPPPPDWDKVVENMLAAGGA